MVKFKDRPIKNKLTIIIMLSTFLSVLLLSTVFTYQRYTSFKQQITDEFSTITKIIADRSNAAVLFEDDQAIKEILSSLALHNDVLVACTYNAEARLLASYNASISSKASKTAKGNAKQHIKTAGSLKCPKLPRPDLKEFSGSAFELTDKIISDGQTVGLTYIKSSTLKLTQQIESTVLSVIGLSSFIIVLAFIFANYVQRFISDPLIKLKDATIQVSIEKNRFPKLTKKNDDEVGTLVDSFNNMLTTIEQQKLIIKEYTYSLEKKVEERTQALENANKELEAFSYSVSHDLKAPLRVIEGFSRALDEDYGDAMNEEAKDYLNRIRTGGFKMSQLITNLLQLSRVTRHELKKEIVDFSELCRDTLDGLQTDTPERQASVIIEENMLATGDEDLIQIILDNLLGNAWKYSQKSEYTKIEVGTKHKNGVSIHYIKDNGTGFDMKYAENLFKPFNRLHTEEEFEGTGVGLATAARIIKRHHGKIWAESEIGKGTTFFFTLFPESSNTQITEPSEDLPVQGYESKKNT
jgi:signal transduction histidine kinase